MIQTNLYKILGVPPNASTDAIKKAYRKLAIQYHPDKNRNPTAPNQFQKIASAYSILSDPQRRAIYDYQSRMKRQRNVKPKTKHRNEVNFPRVSKFLAGFFGHSMRKRPRYTPPIRGGDLYHELELTLQEVAQGGRRVVTIEKKRQIAIVLEPGIKENTRLKVPKQGKTGLNGGPKGDLYLTIKLKPHQHFVRKDDDLYCKVKVDFVHAILGTTINLPTLNGHVKVKVPPGVQPDQLLCIPGKGLPAQNGTTVGDMYVKLKVTLPKKITPHQRQLLELFDLDSG